MPIAEKQVKLFYLVDPEYGSGVAALAGIRSKRYLRKAGVKEK
jgi:catalase